MKFNFEVVEPPSEELIDEYHMLLAKILINKYGVEIMTKVLEVLETEEK